MHIANIPVFYPKRPFTVETRREEKIRREIRISLFALEGKLTRETIPCRNSFFSHCVSFIVPGTHNEAFIYAEVTGVESVTIRVDVMRKGTGRVYSRFLKSYHYFEAVFRLARKADCEEIYNSVIFLSAKADGYYKDQNKLWGEVMSDA